ncbi:hypothetical protein JAAARDRAFT_197787 [Jaapia argillacea MUCL 33604]|uniref:Uncharacterized protein n=1 Tax=Jaapia argillacea MUCL 33604 TaxID=933084 RepID=A0A067PGQ4_9AGAM|nr:hypothetical protein JAAARDRAFT_197787 [Jaapia argillacea MUCL 33604]
MLSILSTFVLAFALRLPPAFAKNTTITWSSPTDGEIFGPGDTITGQWTGQAVTSPSFRLCETTPSDTNDDSGGHGGGSGDDSPQRRVSDGGNLDPSCGQTVWPTVDQDATSGSFSVSLAVPDVGDTAGYFLQMQDDFGNIMASPPFTLASTLEAPSSTSSAEPVISPTLASTVPVKPATPHDYPDYVATRVPSPIAAVAVPLSIVGFILLSALILSILHWRQLKAERRKDIETLKTLHLCRDDLPRNPSFRIEVDYHRKKLDEIIYEEKTKVVGLGMDHLQYRHGDMPGHSAVAVPLSISRASYSEIPRSRSGSRQSRSIIYQRDRQPERRHATRRPFVHHHSRGGQSAPIARKATMVPARLFRSPRTETFRPMEPRSEECHNSEQPDATVNATVNHSLISNYLHPSPIPSSLCLATPPYHNLPPGLCHVQEPEMLYVRREAHPEDPYDRKTTAGPLPFSGHGDVYDKVANLLNCR